MEGGLGSTRMGSRSSTRHGPASVFQGRVRRWKKSWAPVAPSLTPSAAVCRVLLYKWTPVTVPATNGIKESTPEELSPAKPLRFLPVKFSPDFALFVSVVLQQRKEEAQKVVEEAEALASLEQEADVATSLIVETDGAEAMDANQDTSMVVAQLDEIGGATVTESADQGLEGDTHAIRTEADTLLQKESAAAPNELEAVSMDVDESK